VCGTCVRTLKAPCHSWTTKVTSSGSGWLSIQALVRLLAFTLAHAMKRQHATCGNPCLLSTANAQSHTLTADPTGGNLRLGRQCIPHFWAAYGAVLPSKRHRSVGKETGKTSYVERLNNKLRQRVFRTKRNTLSFSKSLENHIGIVWRSPPDGAIWYFIHYYNASLHL
jgi:hypothetical protein